MIAVAVGLLFGVVYYYSTHNSTCDCLPYTVRDGVSTSGSSSYTTGSYVVRSTNNYNYSVSASPVSYTTQQISDYDAYRARQDEKERQEKEEKERRNKEKRDLYSSSEQQARRQHYNACVASGGSPDYFPDSDGIMR